jgi:hypothetical protein
MLKWFSRRWMVFLPYIIMYIELLILPLFQNTSYVWTKIALQNKSYDWWNISQTSSNEPECCKKNCKCCCWWTTKSNNILHLFNDWHLDSTASAHINAILCALVSSPQNGGLHVKLAPKVLNFIMDTHSSPEKCLVRAMQRIQFLAKSAKMTLNPRIFENVTLFWNGWSSMHSNRNSYSNNSNSLNFFFMTNS